MFVEPRSSISSAPCTPMSSATCTSHQSSQSSDSVTENGTTTVFAEKYDLKNKIGEGHYAEVYRCTEKSTGKPFAVKCFDRTKNITSSRKPSCTYSQLYREASILVSLDHRNILTIQDVFTDEKGAYLVLELATNGTLFDRLDTKGRMTEVHAHKVFKQLCEGLKYLHGRNIVHRDIKLENILLVDEHLNIKICDFGIAQSMIMGCSSRGLYGTPAYMAPEVFTEKGLRQYTPAVDVWSAGVILYVCLCGFPPFSEQLSSAVFPFTLQQQIALGYFAYPSPFWDPVSTGAMDLIDNMLIVNARKRFTMKDCLKHGWVEGEVCNHKSRERVMAE